MDPTVKENYAAWTASRAGVLLDYNPTLVQRSPLVEQNGSPDRSDGSGGLMSLNVSSSQFLNAINFEDLKKNRPGNNENSFSESTGDLSQHEISANDHSELLQRFNQLRQWQLQQQQSLMRQQQLQLQQLQGEQQRVQAMLAKQKRQMQWGSPKAGAGVVPEWSSPRKVSSPKKSPQKVESTLPRAIARGTLAQARSNRMLSRPLTKPSPVQQELRDILSDTESEIHSLELEEGIQPLPDTASEMSDYISGGLGGWAVSASDLKTVFLQGDTIVNSHHDGKLVSGGVNLISKMQSPNENVEYGASKDYKSDLQDKNEKITQLIENNKTSSNVKKLDRAETSAKDEMSTITGKPKSIEGDTTTPLDERPVGGTTKTFEELLEIQLQKEEQEANKNDGAKTAKRSFLRKGQGIARFGLSDTPPRKPQVHKSKTPKQPSPKPVSRKIASKTPPKHPLSLKLSPMKTSALSQTKLDSGHLSDSSFHAGIQEREHKEQFEREELEEFELLEKYADASFMSNPSPLVKANWRAHMGIPKQSSKPVPQGDHNINQNNIDNRQDLDTSSVDGSGSDQSSQLEHLEHTLIEEEGEMTEVKVINESPNVQTSETAFGSAEKPIPRKIASLSSWHSAEAKTNEDQNNGVDDHDSNLGEDQVDGTHGDNDSVGNQGDSDSGGNQGDSDSDVGGDSDHHDDNDGLISVGQFSVIHEENEDDLESNTDSDSGKHGLCLFDFNDEESWDRKDTPGKKSAGTPGDVASLTPPTSKLMTKLFPKLKKPNEVQPASVKQPNMEKLEQARQQLVSSEGVHSKVLLDKLKELETEIEKFRTENATLNSLRKEREQRLEKMKKEVDEFEKQKGEELKRIQEYKTQEMKKIKHERKIFDQYRKAAIPDKKEREEIENLKTQLTELQEEMRKKEARWTANSGRLRSRIEQLETENAELKNEVKILEKKRLELWQKSEETKISSKATSKSSFSSVASDRPKPVTSILKSNIPSTHQEILNPKPLIPTGVHKNDDTFDKNPKSVDFSPDAMPPSLVKTLTGSDNKTVFNLNTNNSAGKPASPVERPFPIVVRESSRIVHSPEQTTSMKADDSLRVSLGAEVSPKVTSEDLPETTVVSQDAVAKPAVPRKLASTMTSVNFKVDKGDFDFTEETYPDGKIEKIFSNGAREVVFPNGTRREISSDGLSVIVSFFNGDIKQVMPDQRVVYYYADAQTTHTTYPDGLEILQFPNGQTEKTYPDGTKEISFPDHTIKYLYMNGLEETLFQDGTVVKLDKNGDKTIEFPNGQREVHTAQYKRREYPDGTVKTIFPDGKQETHYSNGRIRIKDKLGHVIVDKVTR